jgi:predicted transcriptional regulator
MSRASWLNDDNLPMIDEHVAQLEHFTQSMADGQIDKDELDKQEANLIEAMKSVEADLSDEQHAKVTRLMVELTAYNVMNLLHELARERVRAAFAARE